jgi:SAM-dependent methyltransferase
VHVDPSNAEQLENWNGDGGAYWVTHAERIEAEVADYLVPFLDTAAIQPTDHVLDIGCGSGRTTREAARRAASGTALGVDLSGPLLDLARRLAARDGLANVTFAHGDAQVHPFPPDHYDIAISRNGAMFFGDPVGAFGNIGRALRPGGRLVLQAWQPLARNEWLSSFRAAVAAGRTLPEPPTDKPSPFSLSEPDRVRAILTSAGFTDVTFTPRTEQMYFGPDVDDALTHISDRFGGLLDDLADTDRKSAVDTLRDDMTRHLTADGVRYDSAAWFIEATYDG